MNETVKAVLILNLFYFLFFFYAFGVFWQGLVFKGSFINYQELFEPVFYFFTMLISHLYLFKTIFSLKKANKFFNEKRLLIPSFILLIILGVGSGIHTVAQMLEDSLGKTRQGLIYKIAFFLDEYPGHYLVSMPLFILMFFLSLLELNRKKSILKKFEKTILTVLSLFNGVIMVIGGFEGGSQYIVLFPLVFYLALRVLSIVKKYNLSLWNYPFSFYYLFSMLIFLFLTPVFGFIYGFNIQPEADLGWSINLQK